MTHNHNNNQIFRSNKDLIACHLHSLAAELQSRQQLQQALDAAASGTNPTTGPSPTQQQGGNLFEFAASSALSDTTSVSSQSTTYSTGSVSSPFRSSSTTAPQTIPRTSSISIPGSLQNSQGLMRQSGAINGSDSVAGSMASSYSASLSQFFGTLATGTSSQQQQQPLHQHQHSQSFSYVVSTASSGTRKKFGSVNSTANATGPGSRKGTPSKVTQQTSGARQQGAQTPNFRSPQANRDDIPILDNGEPYFLNSCFFILEQSKEEELETEEDRMAEKLKFFYPRNVPLDDQLMFVGFLQSFIVFTSTHSADEDQVSVISFQHSKLALQHVGNLIFALGAPGYYSEHSVRARIKMIIDVMKFFNGPLQHVERRLNSPAEFEETVKKIGLELSPLVIYLTQSPSSSFDPLPYTELPMKSTSLFVAASQMLDILSESDGYIGGCVLYDDGVLCTQIDERTTRWISYRTQTLNMLSNAEDSQPSASTASHAEGYDSDSDNEEIDSHALSDMDWIANQYKQAAESGASSGKEQDGQQPASAHRVQFQLVFSAKERIDYCPIFVSRENAQKLRSEAVSPMQQDAASRADRRALLPSFLTQADEDGEYFCLIIHRVSNVSLAVVMEIDKLIDVNFVKHLRSSTKDKLRQLERKMKQQIAAAGAVGASTSSSTPFFVLRNNIRTIQSFGANGPQATGNSLVFDQYNRVATGLFQNERFVDECALAHDLFERNPAVTKVILKTETEGYLYSKKIFGSEVYYRHFQGQQQQPSPTPRQGKGTSQAQQPVGEMPLDKVEPVAREAIRIQYKFNVL